MQKRSLLVAVFVSALCLLLISPGQTQTKTTNAVHKENSMATHASGTFEVKLAPQTANEIETAAGIMRMTIDKVIHGDLEATTKGEMIASSDGTRGSGAYSALELVTGTLNGRTGTFVLQHTGSMTKTSQQLMITVVPESGTGELMGLEGKFVIKVVDKKHFYEFEYSLPAAN